MSASAQVFRPFEVQALAHLLADDLASAWLDELTSQATLVSYEYSGCGYFLTVAHPRLPAERQVYSHPPVFGRAGEVEAGFLAFIERGKLVLECHSWGASEVPVDFRDLDVQVTVPDYKKVARPSDTSAA